MQRIAAPFAALAPDDLQGSAVNEPLHRGPGEEGIANLLIAGASKAGTSSLFAYLAQHPDICPSDMKEVRYFDPLRYGKGLAPLEEYRSHWACAYHERYRMEATPGYMYDTALAEVIQSYSPQAKVIISLREPVDRMWSYYRFVKNRTRIPADLSFSDYIGRCLDDDGYDPESPYKALHGGCYYQFLPHWIKVFGSNLKVVMFDDLCNDTAGVYHDILDWLRLPYVEADLTPENVTRGFGSVALQRLAVALNRKGSRFFPRHPQIKRGLRRIYYSINSGGRATTAPSGMPEQDRQMLVSFYASQNTMLRTMLDDIGVTLSPSFIEGDR